MTPFATLDDSPGATASWGTRGVWWNYAPRILAKYRTRTTSSDRSRSARPTAVGGERRLDTGKMNADGSAHDISGLDKKSQDAVYAEKSYSITVNRGHEQFFPGRGAAVYHEHNTIQIV